MSTELEAVLAEADALFRERFKGRKVMFVLLAVGDNDQLLIRSNAGPAALADIAETLSDVAEDELRKP
jgi:hypothetical protein